MPSLTFEGTTEYLKRICDAVLATDAPPKTVAEKPKPRKAPEPVAATPAEPSSEPVAATPAETKAPEPVAVPTIEATRKALQDFMGRTSPAEAGGRLQEFGYPNVTSIPECRRAEFIASLQS